MDSGLRQNDKKELRDCHAPIASGLAMTTGKMETGQNNELPLTQSLSKGEGCSTPIEGEFFYYSTRCFIRT